MLDKHNNDLKTEKEKKRVCDTKKNRQITEQEIREAMDFSTAQVKRNLPEFTTKFQKAYSENGFYAPTDNVDWTTGFWTGEIWLSYEDTGKDIYKKAGEIQIDSFLNRIENKNRSRSPRYGIFVFAVLRGGL